MQAPKEKATWVGPHDVSKHICKAETFDCE